MGISVLIICKFSNERMCTRKKDVEKLSCGFEEYLLEDDIEALAYIQMTWVKGWVSNHVLYNI